ncbi:MAG: CRISPR-associated endonuclease Cas2 [Polyangiaceae bacterium]|nr:CRISPR-associated endonuclease Cas2 [Polyangiaceae bacterium]
MVKPTQRPGVKSTRPWHAERPGAAAVRQDTPGELFTLVAFDIPCDKTRRKVGELCKDYGLTRTQWSVFEGPMSRNRREELSSRVERLLTEAEGGGRAIFHPIGERELAFATRFSIRGKPIVALTGTDSTQPIERPVSDDELELERGLAASIEAFRKPKAGSGNKP